MSKPTATRYRTTNWSRYSASLKKRCSLLIWLDKDSTLLAPPDGSSGRPAVFSDAAVQFCLMVKVPFKLPLRQTSGVDRFASGHSVAGAPQPSLGWAA